MENDQRYSRKPNFDMHTKLSRDGRYWIIKRTETWILPRKYIDVIAQNHDREATQPVAQSVAEPQAPQPQKKGKRNADSNGQGN